MTDMSAIQNFVPTIHNDTYHFISPTNANLSNRYILITGASKGLGRAMAISYAQAGVSGLALVARSSLSETVEMVRKAALKAGRSVSEGQLKILEVKFDTTSEEDVTRAVRKVEEGFGGKLDVVVNNAGYLEAWKPIVESDPAEWWKTWEVNIKGTYLVSRGFIPLLLKTSEGLKTIVTVSSMGGLVTMPHASAYQASKTAQIRLTSFLCADYREEGLLAYTIHPGSVKTELASGMPEFMQKILVDTPEIGADTLVWLTKERREWLNDRFVNVRWDCEELERKKEEIVEMDLLKFKMAV